MFFTLIIYINICIFFNALYAYFLINTKFFGVLQKGLPSGTHERREVIIITSWQLYQVLQAFQSMLQLHLIRLCKHWNLFRAAPYIYISNTPESLKFVLLQLFFPMCHMEHWFVFVVALRDGYFIFLDSFFREEQDFSKNIRSIVVSWYNLLWLLPCFLCMLFLF